MEQIKKSILFLLCVGAGVLCAQSPSVSLELIGEAVSQPFPSIPQKVVVDKTDKPYYYLAAKGGGLLVYDIQDISMPILVKTIPVNQFDDLEVMNATQRGNLLFLALGNFFGNNGQRPGLAVLNVGDPLNPVVLDVWSWDIQDKGSASVAIEGDYAYLCAMSQGLITLDISQPDSIKFISRILPDPDFPLADPDPPQVPNARAVAIRDDIAYLCYDAGGLRVINLSDKTTPVETGRYINLGMGSNKQQAFNDLVLDGDRAYVSVDYCGLEVLDIADTSQISQISWWNPWQCQSPSNIWVGSPGHTNQMAYHSEYHYVFLASAQSELSIVDVSNPDQPVLAGGYGAVDDQQGTWGMTLDSNRIFLAYIQAVIPFVSNWAGVRILEWNNTTGLDEPVGYMHTSVSPNPFRKFFRLEIELRETGPVDAVLYDPKGNLTGIVHSGEIQAGHHTIDWEHELPPGIYYLQLITRNQTQTLKMIRQ
ncbi:MAG: T9SS type A sorting domain-containing protein [Saprospiraceae bacterium]